MPMSGKEVRQIRTTLGLTLAGMADLLGVHWNTVARWERDEIRMSEPTARLVRILSQPKLARKKARR